MLMIETVRRLAREVDGLPMLSRAGVGLMVVAGAVDVLVHLVTGERPGHQHGFGPEPAAHLLGIVGMVLVLAGVALYGARRQLCRSAAKPGGIDPHAHR